MLHRENVLLYRKKEKENFTEGEGNGRVDSMWQRGGGAEREREMTVSAQCVREGERGRERQRQRDTQIRKIISKQHWVGQDSKLTHSGRI